MSDSPYQPFRGLPAGSKLLLAFSGGIDSTIAAYLCKQAGYIPLAVNMRLLKDDPPEASDRVRRAADALDMELEFLDLQEDFQNVVMRYCWEEYQAARTPNPCVVCNPMFKFGRLMEYAKQRGCAGMATGHYARIFLDPESRCYRLARGVHRAKDQSYFLCGLTQEQLAFSYMPLGAMTKDQVRGIARSLGLPNAEAPESQDACFTPRDGSPLAEMLRTLFHAEPRTGNFIEAETGRVLGHHCGVHAYTIGQRKGTGVALGKPAYVKRLCAADCSVELTTDPGALMRTECPLQRVNWMDSRFAGQQEFRAEVQIRYRSPAVPSTIRRQEDGSLLAIFDTPQRAVTPGQAGALYRGDEMIAGSRIAEF